jgi:hypothetical protein
VEAMGLEPTNLLTASQALYQLSYAPEGSTGLECTVRLTPLSATRRPNWMGVADVTPRRGPGGR